MESGWGWRSQVGGSWVGSRPQRRLPAMPRHFPCQEGQTGQQRDAGWLAAGVVGWVVLGSASFPISLTFRLPVPFQPPSRCYGLPTVALGDSREQDKTPVPTCARPVRGTLVTTMPPDVL